MVDNKPPDKTRQTGEPVIYGVDMHLDVSREKAGTLPYRCEGIVVVGAAVRDDCYSISARSWYAGYSKACTG